MENYKSLFAKVFNLSDQIQLCEGLSCKHASNHYLAALLHFSPKFVVIFYQKVFFFYKSEFIWTFENILKSFGLVQIYTTWKL